MSKFWVCLILFATWTMTTYAQDVEWVTQAGGSKYDSGMDISLDSDQNSLVVGVFSDSLQLEDNKLIAAGGTDLFVAKYDALGALQWVNQAGGQANDEAFGVVTDESGSVYVTGYFRDTIDFEGNKLYAAGLFDDDIFLAKYLADGTFSWVRQLGGAGSDIAYDIAASSDGHVYLTGRFSERLTAPINDIGAPFTFLSKGGFDIFVAKYNADGERTSISQYGGIGYDSAQAIALDNDGNYYLTGFFNGTIELGDQQLMSNGDFDLFVAKFDSNNTTLWANNAGGAYIDLATAIDLDVDGNAYITGSYEDMAFFEDSTIESIGSTDYFLAKLNGTSGSFDWVRQAGGNDADIGLGIAVDANGNSHVTGAFSEIFVLGEDTLRTNEENSGAIFLLQYNTDGTLLQKNHTTGSSYDEGTAIVIDEDNNCYLTGSFSKDMTIGENTLNANGNSDLFVTKLKGDFTDIEDGILASHQSFLQVYPNPVSSQLFVEFETEKSDVYSLQLSDYAGKVVYKHFFESTHGVYTQSLDVAILPKGMYILQLRSNEVNISRKLVVN